MEEHKNLEQDPLVQHEVEQKNSILKSKWVKIGITILVLAIIAGGIYFLTNKNLANKTFTTYTSPTPNPTTTASKEDTFTDLGNNVIKYSSPSLGITFNFLKKDNGQTFYVTRSENIVCISYDQMDTNCQKGQSVEVFSKDASQTLKEAIETEVLTGVDPKDCFVKTDGLKATLSFPKVESDQYPWFDSPEALKCPVQYRETNGVRYFLSDTNHPDKFAFFNLGQYAIMGSNDGRTDWAETFKFTP